MKHLLSPFFDLFMTNEGFQQQAASFERAMLTSDWKFMKDVLLVIRGQMATNLLSRKYTQLDANKKDVIQQTYYGIDEIIEFLLSPVRWVKKKEIKPAMPDLMRKRNQPRKKG